MNSRRSENAAKQSKRTASFNCDVCKAAFNQKIHLKNHSAKHTGIKPFKCSECNYSTVERSHLKVHVRVHTGEKPFKCSFCEYATAQSSTLKVKFTKIVLLIGLGARGVRLSLRVQTKFTGLNGKKSIWFKNSDENLFRSII